MCVLNVDALDGGLGARRGVLGLGQAAAVQSTQVEYEQDKTVLAAVVG